MSFSPKGSRGKERPMDPISDFLAILGNNISCVCVSNIYNDI
jgi:hypothetical protein